MGKVKQNKRKNRHKPTGMISVAEAESQEASQASSSFDEKTLPILEKLNCPEEREHACAGLANLVLGTNATASLMKHKIVRRVAPLILDKNEKIQEAATGVLRNLTLSGSSSICEEMIEQDIMTPLIYYIKKFSESSLEKSAESNEAVRQQSAVHEQVTHLLLNLSENASEAIKKVNDENIVPVLATFLNPEMFPMRNVLLTAQCLCIVTEDNPIAAETLANNKESLGFLERNLLNENENEEYLLHKVYIAGVLFNISQSLPSHVVFEMFQAVGSMFGKVLSYDICQYAHTVEEKRSNEGCEVRNGVVQDANVVDHEKIEVDYKKIEELVNILKAQQTCLEILTNMCCSSEIDEQDWDGVSSDEFSSEENEVDCTADAEMESNDDSSGISQQIVTSVVSNDLPKKVLEKCSFVKLKFKENGFLEAKTGRACMKIMKTIQTRALVCLNNMLSTIDINQLGGAESVTQIWNQMMEIAFQNNESESPFRRTDDEFIEAATGAIRSVLEKLPSANIQCVTAEQVQLLCYLCSVVKPEAARVSLMNVLGIIGKMLITSNATDPLELLQSIGTMLRDVVMSSESLWVIAEALDAIFDVFADNPTADVAAGNIELLAHLEKVVSILKSRVKRERSSLGDRFPIISTARTNLIRFLKYKKQIS